ncbi:MAG: class I SAM-dependent methyltransferase [Actinomycetota bacterium]|nr:class I SAM-dependent methyltransferase [Actinomycetota bacterium]
MAAHQDAQATVPAPPIDEARIEEFAERILGDLAATMATAFSVLGDRLGLFRALSEGAATSDQLAARTRLDERYVREWASGLMAAGYLDYESATQRFTLPVEHAAVLSDEGGPAFLGGAHQFVGELLKVLDPVEQAFRHGGGVPLEQYGDAFWQGVERLTGISFEHQLVQEWIPAVVGLEDKLRDGAVLADIGCGSGVAAIKIANAFPRCEVHGFDIHAPNIARAARAAREAGVDDRVSFQELDAIAGIPGSYDVITFFDVVHDSRDPVGLMSAARAALRDAGVCVVLEINCHEDLDENTGPVGALFYGSSLLHCMTQSLAADGAGLGSCGLPEARLRSLCLEAGFQSLECVAEGPLDLLYEARVAPGGC